MLFDRNPRWYEALTNAIPETISKPCPHPPVQSTAKLIKIPRSYKKKLHDSALTKNPRPTTTAPNLTVPTHNNLRLKVPDWRLWVYTDGSCITLKIQQLIGAGVFIALTKLAIYVDPGGVGISNTVNRAELTGIASALRAKYTHIATDIACSLSQTWKQLLVPKQGKKHTCVKLLEQIVSMISKSDSPEQFHKLKPNWRGWK